MWLEGRVYPVVEHNLIFSKFVMLVSDRVREAEGGGDIGEELFELFAFGFRPLLFFHYNIN